jgi:hypothetical protein
LISRAMKAGLMTDQTHICNDEPVIWLM